MCVREHKSPGLTLALVCVCMQGGMSVREDKNPGLAMHVWMWVHTSVPQGGMSVREDNRPGLALPLMCVCV